MANVGPPPKNHRKMLKREDEREWRKDEKRVKKAEIEPYKEKPGY